MSKKQTVICDNCKKPVGDRNFGIVDRLGNVADICSLECRRFFMLNPSKLDSIDKADYSRSKTKTAMSSKPAKAKKSKLKKPDLRPRETDVSKTIGDDLKLSAPYESRLQSGAVEIVKGRGKNEKRFYMNLCTTGTPDRIAANGLIIFFEVKKLGELPSDDQKRVISDLRANGALVFVVDNYDDYSFIKRELIKRRSRVAAIQKAIAEIQNEIDMELKNKNGL